ncbi:hypothetical protein [uncultured Aquimarina sp.]|uniref:hypothetical protein n=1 Tax=uncultured Aquimarina sp. TaxID=575652 RepID=UPI00260421FB|nr:hypothetical protein [uncultured Aquimarina sp.]
MKIKLSICFSLILMISIFLFNGCKEIDKEEKREKEVVKPKLSPYVKLLEKTPIYNDSIYSIYITSINNKDKIYYVKKGELSEVQKNSKFFLHVYPVDKSLLKEKTSNLAFDFKNNAVKFMFNNEVYYVSQTDVPDLYIDKINTGQYGYNGDPAINWRIKSILRSKKILPIIKQNGDRIYLLDYDF